MTLFHRKDHKAEESSEAAGKQPVKNVTEVSAVEASQQGSQDVKKPEDKKRHSIFSHLKPSEASEGSERKKSIADSGPFTVVQDPATGRWITKKNDHWPEEDSWTRENLRTDGVDDKTVIPGGITGFVI